MPLIQIFGCVSLIGVVASLVQAQTIQVVGATIEENQQVAGRNRLVLAATGNVDQNVSVTVTAGNADFEYIRVRPQRGFSRPGVPFPSGAILLSVSESGSGVISRISEITMLPTSPQAELVISSVQISGSLSRPSGALATIVAPVVSQLDVGGNIVAEITSGPRLFPSDNNSTIVRVQSLTGSILGNVTALYGPIDSIQAPNGSIGSAAIPTTIRGAGLVQSVRARSLAQGSTIIAGSLTQNYVFGTSSTAPGGLAGQIIINPSNNAGNAWTGSVQPRGSSSALLTPRPNYTATTASLGGGSVGLVPFRLHREDTVITPYPLLPDPNPPLLNSEFCARVFESCDNCLPVRPHPAPFQFSPRTISLSYYGPIRAETPGTIPVNVYIEDSSGNVNTATDYGAVMEATITSGSSGSVNRTLVLRGLNQVMLIPGVYHVRPKITGDARPCAMACPLARPPLRSIGPAKATISSLRSWAIATSTA